MRITSPICSTKILPSPIFPVRAFRSIVSTTVLTSASSTITSIQVSSRRHGDVLEVNLELRKRYGEPGTPAT